MMTTLRIHTDYIQLGAALKLAGLVGAGSEAKHWISDGAVKVNGQVETRRGRKLRPGDVLEFAGKQVMIRSVGESD
ncbi:MAG: RNA-binding S4 domain-containing protein [Bacillota bacterium]|jgi:ribosome-associated protein